jgi:hypothetical protein
MLSGDTHEKRFREGYSNKPPRDSHIPSEAFLFVEVPSWLKNVANVS